jgi:hypothetical protein
MMEMHSEGRPRSGSGAAGHDARVLAYVLRRLLRGDAPGPAEIGAELAIAPEEAEAALARLHTAGAIDLVDGVLRTAYPLSAVPTRHRLQVGSAAAYANCAVDALAVPFLVDEPVGIESACAQCGEPITLRMRGGTVLAAEPPAPTVWYAAAECCEAGPAVLTRCPYINFFCDTAHAAAWAQAHPERRGAVLALTGAVASARERFASVARAARGGAVALADLSRPRGSNARNSSE